MVSAVLFSIQLLVTLVVGIYFYTQLRQQRKSQPSARRDSGREYERLQKMRALKLSEPLAERVRPAAFQDIVGQEDGIKSLKADLRTSGRGQNLRRAAGAGGGEKKQGNALSGKRALY